MYKRVFDITFGLILMIICLPILVILLSVSTIAFIKSPIFLQKRIGINQSEFVLYKIRTMSRGGEIFPLFKLIRKYGLDELPQLLNIIIGDMSFVGPRPIPIIYSNYLQEQEHVRHKIKPGLTGLAQINGRNSITWKEKFEIDLHYVKSQSILLDMIILLKTPLALIKHNTEATPLNVIRNRN